MDTGTFIDRDKANAKMADLMLLLQEHRKFGIVAGVVALLAAVFPRSIPLVLLALSFISGLAACYILFGPETLLPNLVPSKARKKKCMKEDELNLLKKDCPVCGKDNCNRHRPELNLVALQPWTNIKLPEKVNVALEEIMELILKEFVYTWYRELSEDEAFVDELRSSIRFLVAVLYRRFTKVDITNVIIQKILKTAMRHLHFYLQVKKKLKPGEDIEQAVLDFYGQHLHVAATNRRAELDYLRRCVENLFPHVLPLHSLNCKSLCVLLREILSGAVILPGLDTLADPDVINKILLFFLDDTPPAQCSDPPSPMVPILENFNRPLGKRTSCLHLELQDILAHPEALFPFMQFMKSEASVNVLQFYLSVEEFNAKILTPELSEADMKQLHGALMELYNTYCQEDAFDKIHFEPDIVQAIKEVCDGPPEGVIKLQTTTPLFRAYDHAYNLLAKTFLPLFHKSDDYYKMLCGERLPTRLQRTGSKGNVRRGDALTFSRLGSKIKGVFKSNTIEGQLPDNDSEDSDAGTRSESDSTGTASLLGSVSPPSISSQRRYHDGPDRDLSAWRVTIEGLLPVPDPENPKKIIHVYNIRVRRIDVLEDDFEESNWSVGRRYNEFYVLEQKLTEFHGEFEDAQIPPKKAFGTKNPEFLESKIKDFEQYLQYLLTMPKLKGSELLFTFLTKKYEMTSSFLADINLSKIVKAGAMKIVKERGQHLEPFLESFLTSIETRKARPCTWSDRDSDTVSISSEKMANPIFENNANVELALTPSFPPHNNVNSVDEVPISGIYDTLLYLVENIYCAQTWLVQFLLMLRMGLRHTVDTYVDWFVDYKLRSLTQEHRAVHILHLIRDTLFFDTDPPRTEEDRRERKNEAHKQLKDYIPTVFVKAIGAQRHETGTDDVFMALQYPKLNKQLSYMLLDECLKELFPELLSASSGNVLEEVLASKQS